MAAQQIRWLDEECHLCAERLNSWDARLCKALAYKNKICEKCISKEYDLDVDEFRRTMENFFDMRPCQGI